MRILTIIPLFTLVYAFTGCHDAGGVNDQECADGESQCDGDMVQHCTDGSWVDHDDCEALAMTCTVLSSEAQCVASSDTDSDADSDTDADTDTDTDSDTDTDTDTDSDVDTGTDENALFFDGFTGSTVFTEVSFPYGDPDSCAFPNSATFSNTGTEHNVQLGCYDEAELSADVSLPSGSYEITVAWRTGMDHSSYTGCGKTHFDTEYGAGCLVPMRLILVDGEVVHESAGQKSFYSEVTVVQHDGAIGTLTLAVGSEGGDQPYDTWYDYVVITQL